MTTTTFYMGKEGLEEVSCSEEGTSSSLTDIEELKFLSAKSKKEIAQMYLNGEINFDTMQRWCQ